VRITNTNADADPAQCSSFEFLDVFFIVANIVWQLYWRIPTDAFV
jgi:hypothetical protein